MTEKEKAELDKLREEGKLITKEKYKRYLAMFFGLLACMLLFMSIGLVLFSVGGGNLKSTLGIIGIVITGIGFIIGFIMWGFSDAYRNQINLYYSSKRKYPEYFAE